MSCAKGGRSRRKCTQQFAGLSERYEAVRLTLQRKSVCQYVPLDATAVICVGRHTEENVPKTMGHPQRQRQSQKPQIREPRDSALPKQKQKTAGLKADATEEWAATSRIWNRKTWWMKRHRCRALRHRAMRLRRHRRFRRDSA